MKYVVIGGEAAGMSAASKIKRMEKNAVVHVYEKGGTLSYGACGLPYYVAGYNDDPEKLIARSRGAFEAQGVDTCLYHEAEAIDAENKVVTVRNLKTGETLRDTYDKLMIATGASAVTPKVDGMEKNGVYHLKTFGDGLALREAARAYGVRNVVVVGGGYIGLEAAEAMRALGKDVVCVDAADHILSPFDPELRRMAEKELAKNGVSLHTGEHVLELRGGSAVNRVVTDRTEYVADLVVVAAGVRPATRFAREVGIQMEQNGAIVVDREMRTSLSDIWAAGDCAVAYDYIKRKNVYLPLGTVANKCGRIAGGNMCGGHEKYVGALGSAALKLFGLELGRTGLSEREAAELGLDVGTVTVEARNHPAYYPNSLPLTVKVIYERPSMKLLGAQLAGREGAALRTDIFAVALHAGMTTKELGMTDLVYSPPFSGVWDAVQIACNAAR